MSSKTIIITGASSGIGSAAARALAKDGHRLIITGRSPSTAQIASEIGAEHHLVDYARFEEVRRFARTLLERHPRIDVLVNNVGGIMGRRQVTGDGHEMTLQVNHLSGFLLTSILRRRLEESRGIVIDTSSAAHLAGRIDFDDLENARRYDAFRAYASAKLMNILHTMEIARRYEHVNAVSFHPGLVTTGFARAGRGIVRWYYESALGRLFSLSPEQGGDTLLWLIRGEPGRDWISGEYYHKRKPGRKSPLARPELARRLWEESVRMIRSIER